MRHLLATGLLIGIGAVCTFLAASVLENYQSERRPTEPMVDQAQTGAAPVTPSPRPWMF